MDPRRSAIVRTLVFTILVPGSVTVVIPFLLLPPHERFQAQGLRLFGVLLIVLGALLYVRCAWDFASVGRGTPAPVDPPKVLLSRGAYRFTRNPIYVGVASIVVGEAILFGSRRLLVYAFLLGLGFHLFVVFYEEPALRKKFGAAYDAYCELVPRWVPRIPARRLRGGGGGI